ncbi:MAG: coiled-coil domain-containing protein [Planctomycetota bacterium]|jgi:DNA repair exonuclease SbcCD ATPase subunit
MGDSPGESLESASSILKDTVRALFQKLLDGNREVDKGLEEVRESMQGKIGALEERLSRESGSLNDFHKRLRALRRKTRERLEEMEGRMARGSEALEELDGGLAEVRETTRDRLTTLEKKTVREAGQQMGLDKAVAEIRDSLREDLERLEDRSRRVSDDLEERIRKLTKSELKAKRIPSEETIVSIARREAERSGPDLETLDTRVEEKLVDFRKTLSSSEKRLERKLWKALESALVERLPSEETIAEIVDREIESAGSSRKETESLITKALEAFRKASGLTEAGLEKQILEALEAALAERLPTDKDIQTAAGKAFKKLYAQESKGLEKELKSGLGKLEKEIEGCREALAGHVESEEGEERLRQVMEKVDLVEKEADEIQTILDRVRQVMEKIEERIGSLVEVESLQKLVEEYSARVSEEVSKENLAGFLGELRERVEGGLDARLTEFMESDQVKERLTEVTREILPTIGLGTEAGDVVGADGSGVSPKLVSGILRSKEFVKLLDSKFKLINDYLKKDLIPKTVNKMLKKGKGSR